MKGKWESFIRLPFLCSAMKKSNKVRIVLLILLIVVLGIFHACTDESNLQEAEEYNYFKRIQLNEISEDDWNISITGSNAEKCIVETYRIVGNPGDYYTETQLYDMNIESGVLEKISLADIDNINMLCDVELAPDGKLILWDRFYGTLYLYDSDYLNVRSWDGMELGLYSPDEVDVEYGYVPDFNPIACDDEYIYMSYNNSENQNELYILNYDGEVVFSHVFEEHESITICSNISSHCRLVSINTGNIYYYQSEKNTLETESTIKNNKLLENLSSYNFFSGDANYDFYIREYDDIEKSEITYHLIGIKDGISYKIFDFKKMGIESNNFCLVPNSEGGFILSVSNSYFGTTQFISLMKSETLSDYSLDNDKTVITIATLAGEDTGLMREVAEFNLQSEDYYIQIKDYGILHEYEEDALRALQLDLTLEGKIDGILLTGLNRDDLRKNGYLVPLNDYLSTSNVCSEETLQDFVWNCMQDEEGNIYTLYPEFWLYGIIAENEINFDNFEVYVEAETPIFSCYGPDVLLEQLLLYSGDRYIDETNKKLNIDDDFRSLLAFAEIHGNQSKEYEDDVEAVTKGYAQAYYGMIDFPYTFFFNEKIFSGEITCTNICVDAPIMIPGSLELGVVSTSENKEGMYCFFDFIFEENHYNRNYGNMAFPVLKNEWDDWRIRLTAKEDYTDRHGEKIYAKAFEYGYNDIKVEIPPMEEEDVSRMMNLMSKTVSKNPMKEKYLNIVKEESQAYFDGNLDIDTVCKNIENRLTYAMHE